MGANPMTFLSRRNHCSLSKTTGVRSLCPSITSKQSNVSACGGDLVFLVCGLSGLSGWPNEIDKTDRRTRETALNISRRVTGRHVHPK
jgi:hypothetical protein